MHNMMHNMMYNMIHNIMHNMMHNMMHVRCGLYGAMLGWYREVWGGMFIYLDVLMKDSMTDLAPFKIF